MVKKGGFIAWSQAYKIEFPKTPYQFNLHGLSDLQIGSSSTSLSVIKTRIHEIVHDPIDSGIIIAGDIEDEDRPSTRMIRKSAFAGREEVIHRDAQKHMKFIDDEIIPVILPLQRTKYGIMGIIGGHHFTQLSPALNSVQYICQELTRLSKKKVPYLGEMMSYLELTFQNKGKSVKKDGLIVHGEGSGQTKSSTIQKIEKLAQGFDGDFFIRGHDCQLLATKTDKLYPKTSRGGNRDPEMMARTIVYLNLGAATRGYEMNLTTPSYIEQKLLRPSSLGWGTIHFILRRAYQWEDSAHNLKCVMKASI